MRTERKFDWNEILDKEAFTARELADKLGMNLITLRRYLRFAEYAGTLIVGRKGKVKFYMTKDTYHEYQKGTNVEIGGEENVRKTENP